MQFFCLSVCVYYMFIYTPDASSCEGESSEDVIIAPLPAKRIKLGGTCVYVTICEKGSSRSQPVQATYFATATNTQYFSIAINKHQTCVLCCNHSHSAIDNSHDKLINSLGAISMHG